MLFFFTFLKTKDVILSLTLLFFILDFYLLFLLVDLLLKVISNLEFEITLQLFSHIIYLYYHHRMVKNQQALQIILYLMTKYLLLMGHILTLTTFQVVHNKVIHKLYQSWNLYCKIFLNQNQLI